MSNRQRTGWWAPLAGHLRWFIRLRWLAGAGVVTAGLVDLYATQWYPRRDVGVLAVGIAVLSYNVVLWRLMSGRRKPGKIFLYGAAWAQILLDVLALTALAVMTGGPGSPVLGLFAVHMVFAGLMLPRVTAFGAATVTMLIVTVGYQVTEQWPMTTQARLVTLGWCAGLLATVLVASRIAQSLRAQRSRLLAQHARILSMSRRLRRQERRLLQNEKMFALGQMAAGVAHEIANPLASMDSVLQLMALRPDKPRPDAVPNLRTQVERISRIVRDLTSFARPTDMDWRLVSVNELVRESVRMLAFDRRLRQVEVVEAFAEDESRVTIPVLPQAVEQVLVNLLRNALDAVEGTAAPRLRLATRREEDHVIIEVGDNGPGIEPRHLSHLFEPFFTTKPVGKGTGLGLSVSYGLIQKHGGSMAAVSKPGEGATFIIKLPIDHKAAEVTAGE